MARDEALAPATELDPEALVAQVIAIAAIPSPTFAEDARLDWIERRLDGAPGERRRDAVGNLIWSWGPGSPRLLVTAHVDTVFPAATPIAIERDGEWLRGPGVGDNAAAIAVVIEVIERLLLTRGLDGAAVAFTVGEEGLGNLRGARHACAELRPHAMIALEGHGLEAVLADAVGSVRVRLSITGPGGHAWQDRAQPSAIHGLVEVAAALLSESDDRAPLNIGLIEGGIAVNAIAADAAMVLEKRSTDAAELTRFVERLGALRAASAMELTVEMLGERPAGALAADSPLLEAVLGARSALGLPTIVAAGSTDANAALAEGIPALGLGVSRGRDMHTTHESIDVASLRLGARQLEHVLTRLLAG